jgi:MFS family permease
MRRLAAVPYARRYLLGEALSILGDTSLWLALAIWVRELTGSNGDAGLTFFFMAAPGIAGPLWGTAVDRIRRRPMLIAANATAGLMTLSLWFVNGRSQVWLIWVVMAGYGVTNSLLGGAQNGYLKTLMPDELLGDAQGLLSTVREGLRLVSPLIGAGLFAVVGGHVIATIDAATFAVAVITVATIPVVEPKPERVQQRLRHEVAAGWRHIVDTIPIRQVATALAVVCAVVGFTETGIIAVVTEGLHRPATWLGPFEALMGVGALVGGPTVARAMRRLGESRVCALGMVAFALGSGLLVIPTLGTAAAGAVVDGFGLPWIIAAAMTLIQRTTPGSLQGRVSTTLDVVIGTPQALSIGLGAGLVAVVGYQALMGAVAMVTLGAGAWLISRREQHVAVAGVTPASTVQPELQTPLEPVPVGTAAPAQLR